MPFGSLVLLLHPGNWSNFATANGQQHLNSRGRSSNIHLPSRGKYCASAVNKQPPAVRFDLHKRLNPLIKCILCVCVFPFPLPIIVRSRSNSCRNETQQSIDKRTVRTDLAHSPQQAGYENKQKVQYYTLSGVERGMELDLDLVVWLGVCVWIGYLFSFCVNA